MRRLLRYSGLLSGLALGGCVDRYTPDVPPAAQANLVVDGYINPLGTTVIKLARTFSVNTKNVGPAETKAQVAIQGDTGPRYALVENPAGTYTSGALTLDPNQQYQLRITTAQGREYASDKQAVVLTPPVDTLTWTPTPAQGVQFLVSTHGASTAARYYRWEYEETYLFTSAFESVVEYVPAQNRIHKRGASIFRCWRTEPSTAIMQGNSAQLSQNTLADFPLLTVLPNQKLRYGYSILVRQYAQTQAEYDYWERLRKSTENLGTVNDPLPGKVTGNVHALADPAEPVLGYVGVHSATEKRLFISGTQFPTPRPASVAYDPFYTYCVDMERLAVPLALAQFKLGQTIPVQPVVRPDTGDTIAYLFSSVACVDCRQHGTNSKPSFWP